MRKSAARHNTFRCYPTHRVGGQLADHQLPAAQVPLAKINESHFDAAEREKPFWRKALLSWWQQSQPRSDDRERTTRARQAAEALFAPQRQASDPAISESSTPGEPPVRKPRVLAIVPPAPVRHEIAAPASSRKRKQAKPKIPVSQTARIRAWAKYGMTAAQIAEVCGVAAGEIERILQQA